MIITDLKPHQCFVFGSNSTGFHGAGAAGLAFRGQSCNSWRTDASFSKAMSAPVGSPDRIGNWAVYGESTGFQVGHNGCSYAICTVTHPGAKRSVTRRDIYAQLVALWKFTAHHQELEFLLTRVGQGYSGYTPDEMREVYSYLIKQHGKPANVVLL